MQDKLALRASHAGMRLIAQMTIYNSTDFDRLRVYITESYHPDLLAERSVDERLTELHDQYEWLGKVRIQQVIGTDEHRVIVLLAAEKVDGYFFNLMEVEEDYPHRVIEYKISFDEI
ncbi:MAG TPA: hypothetical protein VHD90_06615 [Phototrophicaceae bacterium]|nr:hypothetical protein [Phototrophicaceae bacterium]